MTDETRKTTGGCMCGAVRYEAIGEPKFILNCHCSSCRRHTGAPVVTFVAFSSEQVSFVRGNRKLYESSPGVERAFCGQCGTPLTWEAPSPRIPGLEIIEFHISTLDRPDDYPPDRHFFYGERIAWFDVADNLPRYTEMDVDVAPHCQGPEAPSPSEGC